MTIKTVVYKRDGEPLPLPPSKGLIGLSSSSSSSTPHVIPPDDDTDDYYNNTTNNNNTDIPLLHHKSPGSTLSLTNKNPYGVQSTE